MSSRLLVLADYHICVLCGCVSWLWLEAFSKVLHLSTGCFYVFMPCDSETWREFLHKLLFSRFVSQWGDKGKPIFVNNKCIIMLKIFARVIKAMQDSWLCGQKNNAYDNKSSRKCIYSECICLEIPHSTNMAKDPDKQNCLKGKSTFVRKTSLIVTE